MSRLSKKQKLFGDEYLIDLNGTKAAIRAGYSAKTASSIATVLLKREDLQAYIQLRMSQREYRTEITQDRVLHELARIGFSDLSHYLRVTTKRVQDFDVQEVEIFNTEDITPDDMKAVAEIKQTKEGIALKLHDKVAALEKIGRHLGMFKDKVEVTGEAGGPLQVVFSPLMKPPDKT